MQENSFTKNYLFIYFFQVLSIVLGFASLFVVVPSISSNKEIYGIYSVCTSITIFLSYADLGFLGAGTKYAAEHYARGESKEELEIIGFSHFVLLVVVFLISAFFLFLSLRPDLLITNIGSREQYLIARKLLLILALFSPTVVFQRMIQMIFSIRLQEYKMQRVVILGNLGKILSVLFFFGSGHYDIVGYFLTTYLINIIVIFIGFVQIRYYYGYTIINILRHLKFNRIVFDKVKKLAISSLFVTITWIIYYELDSIVIGKTLGADAVATYAIGLTMIGFIRSILGVFFGPFAARFNHFVGLKEFDKMQSFFRTILVVMLPIVVFPILSIAIMCRPIIISWVGLQYEDSIAIARLLVLCNLFGFLSYPTGNLIVAQERIKVLYWVNGLMPIIFWVGALVTLPYIGVKSFALFKFITFTCMALYYLKYVTDFLGISISNFIITFIKPYMPSILFIFIFLGISTHLFVDDKSMECLFYNACLIAAALLLALVISYFSVRPLKVYANNMVNKVMSKK